MNKVIIMGRLGGDPETGENYTRLSVATSKKWTDKNGQKQEDTQWHRVVFFGKTAEVIATHFSKGDGILMEGSLKYGSYEKEGVTHYTTDIIGRSFEFLPIRKQESEKSGNGAGYKKESNTGGKFDGDDIPF